MSRDVLASPKPYIAAGLAPGIEGPFGAAVVRLASGRRVVVRNVVAMSDTGSLSGRCQESGLLYGTYDCVDRLVLNGYLSMLHSPGGFRVWWRRWHGDGDDSLDDAHLMRLAGRFSRRVRGWAKANGVPVMDCTRDVRKHRIAEEYLASHDVDRGVFMVLVAKAPATVWHVVRPRSGVLFLVKKQSFVNHYSFHILDPEWGHMTIKMSSHPPFGTQILLNGHEWVERRAVAAGLAVRKEGNCFTEVSDPVTFAEIADTLTAPAATGRLAKVCDRWIYTMLSFGVTTDEQAEAGGLRYRYSVYQAEYSRNLLFRSGARMESCFDRVVDRARSRIDVPKLRTVFGAKARPHRDRRAASDVIAAVETPRYDLTWLKVTFGRLGVKAYTKGERVLRIEATVHNTAELKCGKVIDKLPDIMARIRGICVRFDEALDCVDTTFLADGILDDLPQPSQLGASRIGGIDIGSERMRNLFAALVALAARDGFCVSDVATQVRAMTGADPDGYTVRQASYDLRKLRAKGLVVKRDRSRRYDLPADAVRTMAGILALRTHILAPILAGIRSPRPGRKPTTWTVIDQDYEALRIDMQHLFDHLGLAIAA